MLSVRRVLPVLALTLATGLAACGDEVAGPESEAVSPDLELAQFDVFGDGYGWSDSRHAPPGQPMLGGLLMRAVAKVRAEQGDEAARALLAPLQALREEARAARAAGDTALFRTKIAELHAATVQIVVDVLGPDFAAQAIETATGRLGVLAAIIEQHKAEGREVPRLEQAYARASALLGEAEAAYEAGDYFTAMAKATRAAQLAAAAAHHGTAPRGDRPGPGRR